MNEVEWPAVICRSLVSTVVVQRGLWHSESGVDWVELVDTADQGWNTQLINERWSRELTVVEPHVCFWQITVEAMLAFGFDHLMDLWSTPSKAAVFKALSLHGQCFVKGFGDWELIHEWGQYDWCATLCGDTLH
jgi:hypothetical protein